MRHFPIYVALQDRRVVLSGGGEAALAKLRLLLKTEARIDVFTPEPADEITDWAGEGRLTLIRRPLQAGDVSGSVLFYAADEDDREDARTAALARAEGALVNIVDNLQDSAFITPAIVDRDPVTVAIGTEGAAPVLARAIKAAKPGMSIVLAGMPRDEAVVQCFRDAGVDEFIHVRANVPDVLGRLLTAIEA